MRKWKLVNAFRVPACSILPLEGIVHFSSWNSSSSLVFAVPAVSIISCTLFLYIIKLVSCILELTPKGSFKCCYSFVLDIFLSLKCVVFVRVWPCFATLAIQKRKKTRREARGTGVFVMRWCANHLAVKRNGTKRVNLPPAKCYRQDRFVIISAFESVELNK